MEKDMSHSPSPPSPLPAPKITKYSKLIDFHVHVGRQEDWHPWVNDFLRKENPTLFQGDNFNRTMTPEGLDNLLEQNGIRKAVILAEYSPLTTGVVTNEYVHEFCKGRERFIPFASLDPTGETAQDGTIIQRSDALRSTANPHPDLPEILESCVQDMGFKGLKLYPPYQHFYPNDPKMYPLYEKAVELNIPIMFHTGSSIYRNSKIKYGDPIHLDEVAADFPELKIIMAHSGRGFWYDRAFFLSRIHKNLYMEIAGLPPKKLLDYFPNLEKNADKILFGSDWPGVGGIGANVEAIRSLPLRRDTIENILWRNAARVLGIA